MNDTVKISTTSGYGYHPGEWFPILGVAIVRPQTRDAVARLCFIVDIAPHEPHTDYWPCSDITHYQFKGLARSVPSLTILEEVII